MSAGPKLHVVLVALAAGLWAAPAWGQSKTGTTLGQFLLIEPSARISAMGNAGVSLADGLDAVYYNPAGLAVLDRYDALFSHSSWVAGIDFNYVALGFPMGRWGNALVSVTSLSSGEMDVRTVAAPLGTGERFTVSDVAVGVGYARPVTNRFSAGGQIHWLQETIWHSSVNTMTLSLGTIYRVAARGLHIGSSLSYFGTNGEYDGRDLRILFDADPASTGDHGALPASMFTDAFDVPVLFRVGLGYPWHFGPDTRLQVAVDAFHPSDEQESMSMGAEFTLRRYYALRLGWQNAFLTDAETGLTAGFGVHGDYQEYGYRFDYGWSDFGRLGDVHRLSVGIAWGGQE